MILNFEDFFRLIEVFEIRHFQNLIVSFKIQFDILVNKIVYCLRGCEEFNNKIFKCLPKIFGPLLTNFGESIAALSSFLV